MLSLSASPLSLSLSLPSSTPTLPSSIPPLPSLSPSLSPFLYPSPSLYLLPLPLPYSPFPIVKLLHNPPCLTVTLTTPLSCDTLLLSVDCRVGQVVTSMESFSQPSGQVIKALQFIEQKILANKSSLSELIGNLV